MSYSLTFPFDEASLTRHARIVVREAARDSRLERPVRILVTGHADHVGGGHYNYRLSLQRARAVKAALVRHGVDGDLIYVAGRGFDDPAVPTGPGVRERENRQVVIELRTRTEQREALR